MDRSFLSHAEVIAASRQFVCVRLATYEDEQEGRFLKSLVPTASGELENSVFAFLAADGTTPLARPSRSPRHDFADAPQLARAMNRLAQEHPAKVAEDERPPALPLVAHVRLALDVAACDNQPLVLIHVSDDAERKTLSDRLASLIWGPQFVGRFVLAEVGSAKELQLLDGPATTAGLYVVQSDQFGVKGVVLAQVGSSATQAELAACLRDGLQRHRSPGGTFADHVRQGQRQGVFWETVIPVTDPMERRAREKGRRE